MKKISYLLLALLICLLCFGCAARPDLGHLPDYTKISFSSLDDLSDFLSGGEMKQRFAMIEMGFSKDEKASILDFSKEAKNYLLPILKTTEAPECIEIRTVYGTMDPHISIEFEQYSITLFYPSVAYISDIQAGNLQEYYRKAHPSFNRPDSYNEEQFLTIEPIELSRTDMDSEAILFVSHVSAPYIEFIRDGLIVRITYYNGYGAPDQEALIKLANEVIFENVNLNKK